MPYIKEQLKAENYVQVDRVCFNKYFNSYEKNSGRRKAAEGKRKRKTEEEEIASKYQF